MATDASDDVACVAAEPVALAPAPHPEGPSAATNSAATKLRRLRSRIVRELLPDGDVPVAARGSRG